MRTIVLRGDIDPVAALDLRSRLHDATSELRPMIDVDLTEVTSIHVAGVSALISAARTAQRNRGELRLIPPLAEQARRDLALSRWFPLLSLSPRPAS